MRMIMGLDRPSGGSVTVNGRPFDRHRWPLREVGALLEAKAMHPSRRAADHLRWLAASNGLPHSRVDEVLAAVGLSSAALKKPKGYSLGMAQRLGIAAALIGDPGVLLFDEPVNGLDPEGILWIRNLLRSLAAEGRTIFVSSHLMSEMALTADHVIVIGRGRLVADTSMAELVARSSSGRVRLVSPDAAPFAERLAVAGAHVMREGDGSLTVTGLDARAIGELGRDEGLLIYELTPQQASLEEAFMQLTHDSVDYAADEALLTHAGANR
jgi:ABC-2 type transport system ATP-binding protein